MVDVKKLEKILNEGHIDVLGNRMVVDKGKKDECACEMMVFHETKYDPLHGNISMDVIDEMRRGIIDNYFDAKQYARARIKFEQNLFATRDYLLRNQLTCDYKGLQQYYKLMRGE